MTVGLSSPIAVMPGGLPGVGHLPRFVRDPLGFFTAMRDHADVVRWSLGPSSSLFISDPADIEKMFLNVEKTFSLETGEPQYAFKLFAGNGIITTHGEFWRRQRAMMQPGMRPRRIAGYADTMVELTAEMLEDWRAGEVRDVRVEMLRLTQRIAAKTLFGADVRGDAAVVGRALDVASREIGAEFRGLTMFIPPWVPTPGRARLKSALADVERVLYRLIDERRTTPSAERPDDMLGMLLDARDEDGRPMSDRQLRDETMTLYIAGHETTGNTLTWAYTALARHREVFERLRAEVVRVVGGRRPTLADYRDLPYTEAVVKETLRLYPPAWLFVTRAVQDVELGGHRVPAGQNVWTSQWAVHRDPRWFDAPAEFRPERFLGPPAHPNYAWFPFGGGPHVCLGNRFALVEAVLVLAMVAQRYRLDIDPGLDIRPQPLLTLQPGRDVPATLTAVTA
jgi:cytochrome P450